MEAKNHTFLHALKLWLIWYFLMNASWVPFMLALTIPFMLVPGALGYVTDREVFWIMLPILLPCVVVSSLMVGVIQWFAFRGRIKYSFLWILATALGWSFAAISLFFFTFTPEDALPPWISSNSIQWNLLAGATAGAVIGLLQWLVLWRQVRGAVWWILGSILGWASVGCVGYLLMQDAILIWLITPGLFPLGLITGIAYAYLFTQPIQIRSSKESALPTT